MIRINGSVVYTVAPEHSTTQYAVPIGAVMTIRRRPIYEAYGSAHYTADELQIIVDRLRELESEPVKAEQRNPTLEPNQ